MLKLNKMVLHVKNKNGTKFSIPNVVSIQFGDMIHHVQYYPVRADGTIEPKRASKMIELEILESLEFVPITKQEENHK